MSLRGSAATQSRGYNADALLRVDGGQVCLSWNLERQHTINLLDHLNMS